jgi:hypothetical protein
MISRSVVARLGLALLVVSGAILAFLLGPVHTNSKAQETWRGRLPGGIRGLQIRREVAHLSLVGSTPTLSAISRPDS